MTQATRQHRRRLAVLLALAVVAAIVASSGPLHHAVRSLIDIAQPVIERHAIAGAITFVLLSALSAMMVFFSTVVLTPIAVQAFGAFSTFLLLWLGWILGGVTAYSVGRFLGRRFVCLFVNPWKLRAYEKRARRLESFTHVLLFQLAVPSEIPGYVLGLARCRFRMYFAAMSLGELPFAIGAVYMGESFLTRNYVLLLAIAVTGAVFSWLVFRRAAALWTPPAP